MLGPAQKLSFRELHATVEKFTAGLRAAGVKKNDRVAGKFCAIDHVTKGIKVRIMENSKRVLSV